MKVAFIDALSAAGLPVIEATAFVSPKAIPQLADGEEVFRRIAKRPGVRYPVLVPNEKGLDRAEAAGAREIAVFTAASETFNRKNINASIEESFARFAPGPRARAGRRACACAATCRARSAARTRARSRRRRSRASRAARSTSGATRCPSATRSASASRRRCPRSSGADVEAGVPLERLALHFHDTRGTALANVAEGLREGVRIFDSSAGGLGGCPYAPGRGGQRRDGGPCLLLHGMGYETGVDLSGVVAAASRALAARDRAGARRRASSRLSRRPARRVRCKLVVPSHCEEIECRIGFSWRTTV